MTTDNESDINGEQRALVQAESQTQSPGAPNRLSAMLPAGVLKSPAPRAKKSALSCLTSASLFQDIAKIVQQEYWKGHTAAVRQTYANTLKYDLLPTLAEVPIGELEEGDIKELISMWEDDEVERSTIDGRLSVLASILTIARAQNLMGTNPLYLARKTCKPGREFEAEPFTPEEEATLVEAIQNLALVYYCLFLLVLRTGIRIWEALGLQIADVNLTKRRIRIRRSWTCGVAGDPKYKSRRVVGISDDLWPVLQQYIAHIRREERQRWLVPTIWLFPGVSRKKPLNLMALRKNIWKVTLAHAGLPYRRIHDLRHTFASSLLNEGHDIGKVSRWLGHKNISTTYKIYYHAVAHEHLSLTQRIGRRPADHQDGVCPTCERPLE